MKEQSFIIFYFQTCIIQNMNDINGKVLIFSDQHLGLKCNSEKRLKIAIRVFKEIIRYVKENNIQYVISAGDMFHSRSQIDVNVINVGYKLIQSLAKHCKIWMLVGNHDQYLKNTTEINSINIFQDIPNVTLVESSKELTINKKRALLVPWLGDVSSYSKETFDILFGHFDISSKFIMQTFANANKNVIGEEAQKEVSSFVDIVTKDGIVFSGHIHTRKELVVSGRNLVFVGSPYQQTLADINLKCGFYVLNEDCSYKFNEIANVPKHVEIKMSEVLKAKESFDFSIVKDNIVHKVYDIEVDRETDAKISQQILDMKPFEELLPDYEVQPKANDDKESIENVQLLKKSKLEYISNYINNIDDKALEAEKISKDKLFAVLEKYYNELI